jgi:excisionase family DNA binding protein
MSKLLTMLEMANKLSVRPGWIYSRTRLNTDGRIPHLKVGKYLRFEEDKVMEWLRRQNEKRNGN